jgi:hypothetical protein
MRSSRLEEIRKALEAGEYREPEAQVVREFLGCTIKVQAIKQDDLILTDESSPEDCFLKKWNDVAGFQKARKLTASRKRSLSARLKDLDFRQNWVSALDRISKSPFCCGVNDRKWTADIDWFLRPDTLTKIMEGKYDRRGKGPPNTIPLRTNEEPEIMKL